ncbi:cilia- and flagella-associated protein 43-like isoform X2 [Gigantopelta aegis]|uniref:cilia- and flagella-associated protein 43-like isoform X2 n=1 Tax=Gigantopelta aegis TaxID=1735272 RepID=UPI001B88C58B|nr:cilia- and flagella-associated protein 43-like isoform X2 [Gigantopelta aegis]
MDQFGTLELSWAQGITGTEAHYIDNDVVCYQCGKNVKFLSVNGKEQTFGFKGEGQGPIAVHEINKHFAVAEHCLNPKIFIFDYNGFKDVAVLTGGAQLEFQIIAFSASEYFASISGIPDFELVLWKYRTGERLASVQLSSISPTSIGFNPANWRQICVTTSNEITIWQTEQSHDIYLLESQKIKLPAEDPSLADEMKDDMQSRSSTRASRYTVEMPKAAIAGLVGEMAEKLDEIQDPIDRVKPVSHTWATNGDIYIGCKGGQLVKVDGDQFRAKVLYYPPPPPSLASSGPPSAHKSRSDVQASQSGVTTDRSKSNLHDTPSSIPSARLEDISFDQPKSAVLAGSLNAIGYHKKGLFAAGEDGIIRNIDLQHEELQVTEERTIGAPITSICFSRTYTHLVAFSPRGGLYLYAVENPEDMRCMKHVHPGNFIGLSPLAACSDVCVSCKEDGVLQAWNIKKGNLLSRLYLDIEATVIACSPFCQFAVVGSKSGYLVFVDYNSVENPRIIHSIRLFSGPVSHLTFEEDGQFFFVASDTEHVLVVDGHPSKKFEILGYTVVRGNIEALSSYTSGKDIQVVVTTNQKKADDKKPGANELTVFTITPQLLRNIHVSYSSLRHDFKDEFINRMDLHLVVPSYSVALGEGNRIYTISQATKKICSVALPEVKPKRINGPDSYLGPEHEVPGHQLPGGAVALSPHKKWLASFGPDGSVMFRATGSVENGLFVYDNDDQIGDTNDRFVKITPHEFRHGGVRFAAFSEDCHYVFTSGYDEILTCYKWNFTATGQSKVKTAVEVAKARKMRLLKPQTEENTALKEWQDWTSPRCKSRTASAFEKQEKERIQTKKQQAIDDDEIFQTPTPVPGPDATWLEEQELTANLDESVQYKILKKDIRMQLRDIRKQIQKMIASNEELPNIEKLGRHEFDLDMDEQTKLQAEGDAEVMRVKENIEFENLAKIYLREMIKKECWDQMKVKGRSLLSFNSSLEVSNFPMREISQAVLEQLKIAVVRRRMEVNEALVRKQEVEIGLKALPSDDDQNEGEEDDDKTEKPSTTGSLGAQYGGGNDLFYSQFELHTREQKITQIILLQDAIHRIKTAFNTEFSEVFQKKEQEMAKIKDKNKRIKKIMEDLDLQEPMVVPELCAAEKPEMLLTVKDSEVKVEKYMTPEQRKKFEEQKKVEEERRLRERVDNARERALEMMMGGVLEVKKEDELKKDIPKPQFMLNKNESEWTEEEQKLFKEYEKKVKDLQEEREKYRKQLETELRKLQAMICDGMAGFDDTLNQLFLRKIKIMMVIYQEELKINRLRFSLLLEEELEVRQLELNRLLTHKRQMKHLAYEAYTESKKNVDNFRDEYDILTAEDKVLDKSFKREFPDVSATMLDHLARLFRKRPRGQKYKSAEPLESTENPFVDRPSTAKQMAHANKVLEAALVEMDKESNMPEGLDLSTWQRFCKYRRDKIYSEQLVKSKALVLAEMNAFLQKRQDEDESLKNEMDNLIEDIKTLKDDKQRFILNLEVQLLLKQGQVEIEMTKFVPDYRSSVLLHRSVVEELNGTIKQLGESKITSMVESKDFRKGIIQLEWEHKRMLMQVADLQNKMKDIQFMKVTREIQAFLNEDDYDQKKAQEITTLENTIVMLKKHHEKNLEEKKKILKELNKMTYQKQNNNSGLSMQLQDINVSVHERVHIDEVNAEKRKDTGAEKRYQEIVQRRKLVDLAKAQAQEVAVLRAEVERLRMRTFPALVQVEH